MVCFQLVRVVEPFVQEWYVSFVFVVVMTMDDIVVAFPPAPDSSDLPGQWRLALRSRYGRPERLPESVNLAPQ